MRESDCFPGGLSGGHWALLERPERRVTVVGGGSVGKQVIRQLVRRIRVPLVLVDNKSYMDKHAVAGQCTLGDVGLQKADVHATWLRTRGIPCVSYACDIQRVPDGVVGARGLIIVCADNWRCLALANRLARRTGANLVRANVQPAENCLTVSAFGTGSELDACAECSFSRDYYNWPEDDPFGGCTESTIENGRGVTMALAREAASQVVSAVLPIWSGHDWDAVINRSVHIGLKPYSVTNFILPRNPACRHHASERYRIIWLARGPRVVTLGNLLAAVGIGRYDDATLRFDGVIAFSARCVDCGNHTSDVVRWLPSDTSSFGVCAVCHSVMRPVDSERNQEVRLEELEPFWNSRLSYWGVPSGTIIEVTHAGRVTSFALGIEVTA